MRKNLVEKVKVAAAYALPVVASGACVLTCFASDAGTEGTSIIDTAVSSLTTSITSMASSIGGAIGSILPIALPLVGVSLVVAIGLKVFKNITSKA